MYIPSPTELAWINLPEGTKQMFYNISAKDGDPDLSAYDWYKDLVPEGIQGDPELIDTYMNGGTVTQEVWVYDRGANGGHYETVSYEVADKDVSRITSGANGGEYTPDNTVMEDASLNRARGADNMTPAEVEAAEAVNAADAEVLEAASTVTSSTTDVSTNALEASTIAAPAAEVGESVMDAVLDSVLPVTYGAKAAAEFWDSTEDLDPTERVATTALVGGTMVLGTYSALAFIPGLNLVLGGIALYKLGEAGLKMLDQKS